MKLSRQMQASFFLFIYKKNLNAQKSKSSQNQPTKQKQANTKEQRQQFFAQKTSKRSKIGYFAFLKKKLNCPDNFIYYTTELCCLNFAIIKLLLPIYHYSHDAVA